MTTFVELWPRTLEDDAVSEEFKADPVAVEEPARRSASWTARAFAREQIHGLVRQLFLPGPQKPLRRVVFSSVDGAADVTSLCSRVADALAADASVNVAIVDAQSATSETAHSSSHGISLVSAQKRFGSLADASQQLTSNLWFVPNDVFLSGSENCGFSPAWLRGRLAELRLEFDYVLIQGAPAGSDSRAALLGSLTDGLVLILEANATRRVAAQRVKDKLAAANVRLLGVVLTGRDFPVPEALYRRL